MRPLDALAVAGWLRAFADDIAANEALLTDLDRQIGDADHGANMHRGMQAVASLDPGEYPDARAFTKKAAMTLVSTVGGASGPLYGTFFLRLASALPADGPIERPAWSAALRAAVDGIRDRGHADRGDKTMLDALLPAVEAFDAAPDDPWEAAAEAAAQGRDATTPLVARKGRASYLGERSAGHTDPGATSAAMLIHAAAGALA